MQYTIFSMGDPDFMVRVMNGLAMLSQGGTLVTLMKIGILCGAIGGGLKAIFSAGKEFPLFHFFISMLLGMVLFGPLNTVTVLVTPVNPVPGSIYGNAPIKVDHVPFGPAIAGFLLSHVGVALTQSFEQAFGTPQGFTLSDGGFLSKISLMDAPIEAMRSNGGGPGIPAMEQSLGYYLHDCTMSAKALGKITDADILNAPDVLTGLSGTSPLPALYTMTQIPNGGNMTAPLTAVESLSCPDALNRLKAAFGDPQHVALFMDPALRSTAPGNSASPTQDIAGAFSNVGAAAGQNIGNYMAGLMTAVMAVRSGGMGPLSGSQSALFTVATETAAEQRAYQAMGEENMFLRIMRPMTGFFESLLYALGPFMAFLIGLGPEGLRLITKYAALTLWVMLWFPMLAIINLYESTQLEHAMNLLATVPNPGSLDSVLKIHDQIVNMLTTGSELAASTPALTLAILYGGAVTASALQGKLTAGDHINEKLPAPDTMKEMPVFNPSPMLTWDSGSGVEHSGVQGRLAKINISSALSSATSSSYAAAESASRNFLDQLSHATSDGGNFSTGFQTMVSSSLQDMNSDTTSHLIQYAQSLGLNVNDRASLMRGLDQSAQVDASLQGQVTAGVAAFGSSASVTASAGASVGMKTDVVTSKGHDAQESKAAQSGDQRAWSMVRAKAVADAVSGNSGTSGALSKAFANNTALSKAAQDVESSVSTYQRLHTASSSVGVGNSMTDAELARRMMDRQRSDGQDPLSEATHLKAMVTSTPDMAKAWQRSYEAIVHNGEVTDPVQQMNMASIDTYFGAGAGSGMLDRSSDEARNAGIATFITPYLDVPSAATGVSVGAATTAQGLESSSPTFGDAKAAAEHVGGSHATEHGVRGEVANVDHGQRAIAADNATHVREMREHEAEAEAKLRKEQSKMEHDAHGHGIAPIDTSAPTNPPPPGEEQHSTHRMAPPDHPQHLATVAPNELEKDRLKAALGTESPLGAFGKL